MPVVKLSVAQKSDRGLKREVNEDACDYRIPNAGTAEAALGAAFVVADGIGSIIGGDQASRTAVATFLDTYYDAELDDSDPRERIIAAIQDANDAVRAKARTINVQYIGTTVVGAIILPSAECYVFNVGDSRAYLLHDNAMTQITSDHSQIDTRDSYERAKLTAFVGQLQPIIPNINQITLEQGDKLLICTDGLWGLVGNDEISQIVQRSGLNQAIDRLIKRVYSQGARDNVTISLVQYGARRSIVPAVLVTVTVTVIFAALLYLAATTTQTPVNADTETGTEIVTESTQEGGGLLVIRTPTPTRTRQP